MDFKEDEKSLSISNDTSNFNSGKDVISLPLLNNNERIPMRISDYSLDDRRRCIVFTDQNLKIRLFPNFMSLSESNMLYDFLLKNIQFERPVFNNAGTLSKRRNISRYGIKPYYDVVYQGKMSHRPVNHWSNLPVIEKLSSQMTKMTNQQYNVVTSHFYADGSVEIKKHKDKELKDAIIVSLSFGTTRIMRFERTFYDGTIRTIDVPLNPGALCLIDPPTNEIWTHAIPKNNTTTHRMSLVFRYQAWESSDGII